MQREIFNKYFQGLCIIFDREPNEAFLEIYFGTLKELDDDEFIRSVNHVLRNYKYTKFPMPAEFIQAVREDGEGEKVLALEKLQKAIGQVGAYRSVIFDDPAISQTIKMLGGWPKVCSMTDEEWKWASKDFLKIYQIFKRRGGEIEKLIGISEQENFNRGYLGYIPEPVFIGDKKLINGEESKKLLSA